MSAFLAHADACAQHANAARRVLDSIIPGLLGSRGGAFSLLLQ